MGKPLRVLIIEDSTNDAELLVEELRRGGYDPTFERVDTPQATTSTLEKQAWDVILCDYNMPQFNAPAALKLFREIGLDLPFILVSGAIGEDAAVEAMKSGAHDYIMKGNLKRLLPAIERELREAEGRRNFRKAEEEARHAEQYYRLLIENASDIIAMLGEDLTIKYASPSAARLLDYKRGEFISQSALQLVHPDDVPAALEVLNRVIKTPGTTHSIELRLRSKDGRWLNLEMLGKYVSIDPSRTGLMLSARDVTERKRTQAQLRESEERFRQIAESIREVFWMTNPKNKEMLYVSPGYEKIWGRKCESVYDRPAEWLEAIHPEDRNRVLKAAVDKQSKGTYDEEYRILRPDGTLRWIRDRAFPVRNESGEVFRITGIAEDITERREAEDMVQHLAYFDALTGLPNRNKLYDRMIDIIRTDKGARKPTALLHMNLDRFKEVNDTLGHDLGDRVLQEVGRRLHKAMFKRDLVARLGGDEFAVLLLNVENSKDLDVGVQKILKALELPVLIENLPIMIEGSIGIALYPDHGQTAEVLFQRADIALHISKRAGIPYAVYDPAQDKNSPQQLALMGELYHAIEHNQLCLFYQPKIGLKTKHIMGVEALVRWKHPSRGMIPPDQFILPAEQTGLIHPLTRWVTAEGMRQCKAWREAGLELAVSVNLSARNLQDPKLLDQVAGQLRSAGAAPDWMTFEITESTIMTDPAHALDVLTQLHKMGIHLAIDDFGIGYSSLVYLQKLPVDTIKIDKSFVINVNRNQNDALIVRSTIDLAHNLGFQVVAEGVENKDIWDRLSSLGCDEAQGYYMARPLPAEDLTRWLSESPWGLKAGSKLAGAEI